MSSKQIFSSLLISALVVMGCHTQKQVVVNDNPMLMRAKQTLDSLYTYYSIPDTYLLRENFPSQISDYTATYLASEEQKNMPNQMLSS